MEDNRTRLLYWTAVALVLLCSVCLYLWKFNYFQVGTYMDDSEYVVLAKSIAEGDDYGVSTRPGVVLPTRYPFGWPLLLAPVYALSADSLQSLKVLSLLFTIANTLLILGGWRHLGLPTRLIALAVAALYALSPLVVGHAGMLMAEPAFLFWALLALILTVQSGRSSRYARPSSVGLGVAWVFAVYVRTIGLGLLAASLLYLIIKKKWMGIAIAALTTAAALMLIAVCTAVDWHDLVGIGEYVGQFRDPAHWGQVGVATDVLDRAGQGLGEYLGAHLRNALIPFVGGPATHAILEQLGLGFVPVFVSLFVLALVLLGFAANVRTVGLLPTHLFLPLYAAVTVVWPWRGPRFLYGILPFLFTYLLIGGQAMMHFLAQPKVGSRQVSTAVTLTGTIATVVLVSAQVLASARIDHSLNHDRDLRVGAIWIKENAEPDAVIMAEQPNAIYLYSQRASVDLPAGVAGLQAMVRQSDHPYLLIAPRLVWSDTGELGYDDNTQLLLEALQSGIVPATMVFEQELEMVRVYRLGASGGAEQSH